MFDKPYLDPSIKDVVFIHIPKTAGTALRNALVEGLPNHLKLFDYGADTQTIKGDFVNAAECNLLTAADIVAFRQKLTPNRRLFVSGHVAARKYLGAFHPASFITFLREPVERLVSAYKHYVRFLNFTGSFADFYERPEHINYQSRRLWDTDLRNIGFIGLNEFMPEMVDPLSRHLGVKLKVRRENVGRRFGGPAVDENVRARITALNAADVRLYEHVKANLDDFTNIRKRNEARPLIAHGNVKYRRDGKFTGRVSTFEPGRLAEIEVRIGNQVVHRCYADQYLIAKQTGDVTPNRAWAFSVGLPAAALTGQAKVHFVIAHTETELSGSPIMIDDAMPRPLNRPAETR